MFQLTVGYVAGIIAAAIFVGTWKFYLSWKRLRLCLQSDADGMLQLDYGVRTLSPSFSLDSFEIGILLRHGM
jgi:hypothetical protein